jgi:uncharacterized protein YecE (DUF72 family)
VKVGCMGWGYDDWRGPFYPAGCPPGDYLKHYSRVFDLTEVDSSFYRAPPAPMTQRWVEMTPPRFTFSLKLPQELTHKPGEESVASIVDRFLAGIAPIRGAKKLGPLVAQFPPSFRRSKGLERLSEILASIPREYPLAVELRHASWFVPETFALLEERRAVLVWSVVPGARAPPVVTGDFVYVRFVGDRALTQFDRVQRDGREEMQAMRERLKNQGVSGREIFVLLNNHYMGFGPGTALAWQEVAGVPLADLGAAQREPGQATLRTFE